MRVRQLESALSANVDETFATPKQRLEQYPTNAALAAGVLHGARAPCSTPAASAAFVGYCSSRCFGVANVSSTLALSALSS